MKKLISILFFFSCMLAFSQESGCGKAKIGMGLKDVKKLYPNARESKYEKEITLTKEDTLHGLISSWGLNFTDDKLKWMLFSKYIGELNDENFKKCLKATKDIIADYTKCYGEPDELITGNQKYVDPYKKKHWGYDVIEARWKNVNGEKMKVEFTFMGGKGVYQFLVVINHFHKDYPYYE